MAVLDFTSAAMQASPSRPSTVARAVAGIANVLRAWNNRRAFYRLSDLTDVELRDIGLTRSDLHVALGTSLGDDPTTRLRAIVETRRAL